MFDISVERDAPCGSGQYVAEQLVGHPVDDAVFSAGVLHHHYPCLAGMTQDRSLGDSLLHLAGQVMRQAVEVEIEPLLTRPGS